ncbi:aminotransferase class III-fold pyridoxal phosphate-dependent enzyme [Ruminococcus callidus]|uniref:aminotransferase class III-fold pyridoxal phosphate-dependent enzyme n=1 Tax=Ruminococcus callidus TaxID=40519 RepID=UPI0039A1B510
MCFFNCAFVQCFLSTAKALGGGIPLSAVIAKKEIMEQWPSGAHGGTFGGNPLACAAAYETLRVLTEDGVLEHVREIGTYFMKQLVMLQEKYPSSIGDVRGKGLMLAIEIVHPDGSPNGLLCDELIKYALDQQLILLKCGSDHNVIRFIAPLIVEKEQIDQAISVLDMGLKQYC